MNGQLVKRANLQMLERRVVKIEGGHRRLTDRIDYMGNLLEKNTAMTSEVYEIMTTLRGFTKTVAWVGNGMYYFGKYIVLPVAALGGIGYAAFHHWKFPDWWLEMVKFFLE